MTTTSSSAESTEHSLAHDALLTPKAVRLSQTAPRCPPSEYLTDPMLRHMTKTTRRIGKIVPLSMKHKLRDGGGFRWVADSMVTSLAIPLGAVACPSGAREFVGLSKNFTQLSYGDHESQYIDVFLPDENANVGSSKTKTRRKARGMVFFVHGGAWGSGKPWFYRLVTKPFLEVGLAVAVVGYRVYPLCGSPGNSEGARGGVLTQVDDLDAAFAKLSKEYPEWCDKHFEDRFVKEGQKSKATSNSKHHLPHLGTIVVGHSSGAHISLLWMVEEAQRRILGEGKANAPSIDAFIGVSGVYNIGHHFDYEAGRGVEEISPMKPANGYDRKSFARNSPPWKVQHELIRKLNESKRDLLLSQTRFPKRILLVHGAEDDVVPISGTCEAAKILKECLGGGASGSQNKTNDSSDITIDEFYVPKMGHQDSVMDLMMLGGRKGPVTNTVVEWVLNGNRQLLNSQERRKQQKLKLKSTMRSKL